MTTTTAILSILVSSLLLPQSNSFMAQKYAQTKSSLTAASSDENNSRLNELNELTTSDFGISKDKFIDEPKNNLPTEPTDTINTDTANKPEVDEYTRSIEFNLSPLPTRPPTPRDELESRLREIYVEVNSNKYWDLQDEILQLQSDLEVAKSHLSYSRRNNEETSSGIKAIETMLRRSQAKDAEHVFRVTTQAARVAERMGRYEEAERYRVERERAKMMLPQFNLEGLWVGKYGSHGFEMINVTYDGDELIAYKVTGDQNIPRGEISFTADLSPPGYSSSLDSDTPVLDPIVLSETSASKWGTRRLPRYPGRGQAAEPSFQNPQFLEGQLVVIGPGDYFSFAWIPLEHQIFFGRPSPELTLKMLREGGSPNLTAGMGLPVPSLEEGSVRELTDYVARCLVVTDNLIWEEQMEGRVDEWCGIWHGVDGIDEHCYFQ